MTTISGHPAEYHRVIDSTNLRAKTLAREGAEHGTIVIADEQTAGRGRMERKWLSKPGAGAWFTLIIRPEPRAVRAEAAAGLVFLCALAMARTINGHGFAKVTVKWPNDLIAGEHKIGGMMSEMQAEGEYLDWAIAGIGVNLRDTDFPNDIPYASSLEKATGLRIERDDLISEFIAEFDTLYEIWRKNGLSPILTALKPMSATLGKRVRVIGQGYEFVGEARDFSADGSLIVQSEEGEQRTVHAGDVSVRGIMGYV